MEGGPFRPCSGMVSFCFLLHTPPYMLGDAEVDVLKAGDPREIYDLTTSSIACTFCSTPLSDPSSPLIINCSHNSSSANCPARFCNRLCSTRSAKVSHTLLCPARNPKAKELFQFIRVNHWMAFHALVQCTTRLLLSAAVPNPKQSEPLIEEEWAVFNSFASLSLEDREAW